MWWADAQTTDPFTEMLIEMQEDDEEERKDGQKELEENWLNERVSRVMNGKMNDLGRAEGGWIGEWGDERVDK